MTAMSIYYRLNTFDLRKVSGVGEDLRYSIAKRQRESLVRHCLLVHQTFKHFLETNRFSPQTEGLEPGKIMGSPYAWQFERRC